MYFFLEKGPVSVDYLNQLSFVKIKFDSIQYHFKTINNIDIDAFKGQYTGMINKTSGLPSGFGRHFFAAKYVWDGQFYEGKFHGVSRYLYFNDTSY